MSGDHATTRPAGLLAAQLGPHRALIALAAVGMVLEASVAAAFTWLMGPILDQGFVARDPAAIRWLPWAVLGLFLLRGLGVFLGAYYSAKISRLIAFDLRARVFARYLGLPSAFFARHGAGPLVAKLTHEVEQVGQAATEGFKILLLDGLMLVGLLAVMFYRSVELTLTVLLVGPLIGLLIGYVGRRYRRIAERVQASIGDVAQQTQDVVQGEREVKIYGAAAGETERFAALNRHNMRQNLKIVATNSLSTASVQFLAALALAIVLYVATRKTGAEALQPGEFTSFFTAMIATLPSLKRLTTVQALLQRGVAALASLEQLLREPIEDPGGSHAPARVRGRIELDGVRLRYADSEREALRGVDLVIPAGRITALVGRSGSGKSSLAALVPRFFDPTAGCVRLDGIPLPEYALPALRAQIALVSQHVVLFDDSIAANIAYGALAGASRAAIEAAARAAHAWPFIATLPEGLDTRIGPNGSRLSGGQRQRLAIARAILKNAPILILDEATSALDAESEAHVQSALAELMRERTTVVIAHRLSTIEHADQIVVLDEGRIVEVGRHAELLARGGAYAGLLRHRSHDTDDG